VHLISVPFFEMDAGELARQDHLIDQEAREEDAVAALEGNVSNVLFFRARASDSRQSVFFTLRASCVQSVSAWISRHGRRHAKTSRPMQKQALQRANLASPCS